MYIVWLRANKSEGWYRSQEVETLEECFDYLRDGNCGGGYEITKPVKVKFEEDE